MTGRLRQQYHLEPDRGLLNDPNGLAYFKGKYHVFFQWNRFAKNHSYKEWGQFTSADFLSWEFEGSALLPDQSYDIQGVYSGSGYVIQDELYLFYTGNTKPDGRRKSRQCMAVSGDGEKFLKKGPVLETPEEYTEHFRDPKVWKQREEKYFMVVGAQRKSGKGAIALCRSQDGINWEYTTMLAATENYEMIECPDLFSLDGSDVLLFNPQKRDNETDMQKYSFSVYKLGKFHEETGIFDDGNLDDGSVTMDCGFDFYAPQTFSAPDGRRILFAWMSRMEEEQEKIFAENEPGIHCLTLPRELSVDKGRLYQRPVRELYQLLGREIQMVSESKQIKKAYPAERTFYVRIRDIDRQQKLCLEFHQGEAGMEYDPIAKKVVFSRQNWLTHERESKEWELDCLQEIEVWSDYSSLEIFVNGGERVFSSRILASAGKPELTFQGITENNKIVVKEIVEKCKGEHHE